MTTMNKVSNGMNNQKNNAKRMLPFVTEFVKFSTGFAVIIAAALITLHAASAALQ